MILNRLQRYRRWHGGKWAQVTGALWGRKWKRLPQESLQWDESYPLSYSVYNWTIKLTRQDHTDG